MIHAVDSPNSTETPRSSLQLPIAEISGKPFDILIVGAGPAGSSAAIDLCRRGFSVALIDRARFPREKICGDCLLPEAIQFLSQLGIADRISRIAHAVPAMSIHSSNGTHFEIPADILTLQRSTLDTIMAQAAIDVGAVFCLGSIGEIAHDADSRLKIRLGNTHHFVHARVVLLATGAGSPLPVNFRPTETAHPTALAMRCYVRSNANISTGILSYHRSVIPGFAWIFPLGDGLFNVGCGAVADAKGFDIRKLRATFERFVSQFPPAVELLSQGKAVTTLRGFPIQSSLEKRSSVLGGRVLTIGESVGTTYPFTGEGIAPAIRSALIATDVIAGALSSGDMSILDSYSRRLTDELTLRSNGYRQAQKYLSIGWLNDLAARRIKSSARLRELCAGIVAGTVNPAEVYSAKSLMCSLWPK